MIKALGVEAYKAFFDMVRDIKTDKRMGTLVCSAQLAHAADIKFHT